MWPWSLLLDQGEGYGKILERVSGQQQGVAAQVQFVDAERAAEAVQDPAAMVGEIKLPDLLVEAVVDEAVGEIQEKVPLHGPEDLLDAHPILEDAVEHGFTDLVVVQGAGLHSRRSGAEGRATVAPGPVFAVGDVEVDDLLVGDGPDLTVQDVLAPSELATSGAWGLAGSTFQGYGSNVGMLHLHGLRVWGTWLGNHISQHAGFNFWCQEQLWNSKTLSASARSVLFIGRNSVENSKKPASGDLPNEPR